PEPPASWPDYFSVNEEEARMPAIIIPVLWVGGAYYSRALGRRRGHFAWGRLVRYRPHGALS
ncbi:MAG: hypothetical protein WCD87_14020, partial [Pseudolabrys sp.]